MATKESKPAPPAPHTAQRNAVLGGGEKESLPVEVQAAVEELNQEPSSVLEFKVYPDKVTLILFDYRKYTFSLRELAGRIKKRIGK